MLLAVGFPIALILAWGFELTPDGLKRDAGRGRPAVKKGHSSLDYGIFLVLTLAVAYFVADKFFLGEPKTGLPLEPSVAVLPFTNMTQDESNDPFAAGIHDDLLTHLSRIASLKTTSRTSVLQYRNTTKTIPQIGAELGVATVVEAGVQRAGNRVRINVQLIDAAADKHLWAEQYDRELTAANIFDIQNEIATAIAEQLQAALTPDERERLDSVPTQSIAALDSYFRGKQLLEMRTRESLTAAVEYFEQVVELDSDFALAWSGLADAYMLLPEYSATIDRKMVGERSTYAVARALELDSSLPYVSSSAAWSKLMAMNLAYILVDARKYDEALQVAKNVLAVNPGYLGARRNLFLHELRSGNYAAGAASFVNYTTIIGGETEAAREIAELLVAYAEHGEAGQLNNDLIGRALLGTEDLAQVMALMGDGEGALAALRVAIDERSGSRSVLSMKINPAYDLIRDDPRFVALLEEVGLGDL